jgi:hypothetical protein
MAFALVVAARKLRPYFQVHPIKVLTSSPLKKAMTDYNAFGRLLAWTLELSEFDISYYPRTALKSQILANFIAEYSGPEQGPEGEWVIFVDGASSRQESRA